MGKPRRQTQGRLGSLALIVLISVPLLVACGPSRADVAAVVKEAAAKYPGWRVTSERSFRDWSLVGGNGQCVELVLRYPGPDRFFVHVMDIRQDRSMRWTGVEPFLPELSDSDRRSFISAFCRSHPTSDVSVRLTNFGWDADRKNAYVDAVLFELPGAFSPKPARHDHSEVWRLSHSPDGTQGWTRTY